MTKAKLARFVAKMGKEIATEQAFIVEGMGNPAYCSSDAEYEARLFIQRIREICSQIADELNPS